MHAGLRRCDDLLTSRRFICGETVTGAPPPPSVAYVCITREREGGGDMTFGLTREMTGLEQLVLMKSENCGFTG